MEGGQIGQIWGPFMITRGLSCDRVEFGHFGGGQMTPLTPPWLWACTMSQSITVAAYPERSAGNDPESLGLVFLQGHSFTLMISLT